MVLVIVGLMSSAVVMTIPKDPPTSRVAAEDLIKHFNQTAQTSLLSGSPAGFGVSKNAFSFYGYDGEDWIAAGEQRWPQDLNVRLMTDGEEIKLPDEITPLIIFEPTGESSVFTLTLSDFDGQYVLSSKGDGRVTLGSGS